MASGTILSASIGYGFSVGLGILFAIVMIIISFILKRYCGEKQTSESFSTANRNVKSGMIAVCVISSWCWPATLLTSTAWAYSYSFGNFLYCMAGGVQIILFCFLCIQIKLHSPGAHTVSEIVKIRFGKKGHSVLLFYIIATNIMVLSTLLLGGAQAFASATGMHVVAASFLLPLGVVIYTLGGGLKAVFICDWIHTVVIYIIICVLCFKVFASNDSLIGSPGRMWELLKEIETIHPTALAKNYLTWKNPQMFLISWSVCIGGFASVFGDPSYGQKAIAASPKSVVTGYIMGGICWFIIPWALGSAAGLSSRVLAGTYKGFRTYPNALSEAEVSSGMALFYSMEALLGNSGATAAALMLFMSVTSAFSAELVAFSSVFSFDIYKSYLHKSASGAQVFRMNHISIIVFSLFISAVAVIFNYIGVTLGWLMSFYGIILTPEVFILIFSLFWKKTSSESIFIGAPLGTLSGIACWIGSAYHYGGSVDKDTLFLVIPNLIGNFVALFSTMFYMIIISYLKPADFDFTSLAPKFEIGDDADSHLKENITLQDDDRRQLKRGLWVSAIFSVLIVFGGYIIVPLCFYGTEYEFSKAYFTQWIVIMMIWLILATIYVIVYPIYQGRKSLARICRMMLAEFSQKEQRQEIELVQEIEEDNSGKEKVV
ncbi:hypothetical protein HYPBUDRAFT_144284 [Hyphopichia burtonii NRRL Y-1933]|uniref:Na+/solute symporter n=1 Tax=Hyphopichia burtonii NRRL Y-1933 TaxID=984485 RepID=A0A1E4RDA6_9ASCO|nr:hypothetical protein HYPBUDRAFT_144284 [Hyphopichia burtonii NRRL Y-1933]ODV65213.1 hypothetical protein HYPBUDRAFT_144284 [Hyphopichia burtonii NRRL Y-1933]